MSGRFTVEAIFKAVDKMSAPIVAMSKKVDAFVQSTQKGLGKVAAFNTQVSGAIKRAGTMALGAAVATGAIVRDIVTTGAAFDKVLVTAAAKFDPSIKRGTAGFEALRKAAEDIGEKTEFNAQQGAEALKALASSGMTAAQAVAVLPGVVDLATASEVDLGTASEMATKALGAFGLKTKDTAKLTYNLARVSDVMAMSAGETEASMEGLFESIKEGGPVATSAGQSMETFMAMASKLAAAGIEGSVAGTTLKNVFTTFSTKKGTTALKALGISTLESNGKMKDALVILQELENKTKGMGSGKRLGVLEAVFGKIPLAGVASLLDQGTASVAEFRDALIKGNGAVQTMAGTMRDTVEGDIDEFSSAVDGVKIALFSTNNGPIRDFIHSMTDMVRQAKPQILQKVGDAVKWIGSHLPQIWDWMQKIGKAVLYFYAFSTAVKVVQTAIAAYESAVALATAANWLFRKSVLGWSKLPGVIGKLAQSVGLFDVEVAKVGKGFAGWREALNAGAFSQQIQKLNWMLKGGLLVTAGAIGFAIGTWLNSAFGLDTKLESLLEELTGLKDKLSGRSAKGPGLDPTDNKIYADGSIQDAKGKWIYKNPVRLARETAEAARKASDAMRMQLGPESILDKYGVPPSADVPQGPLSPAMPVTVSPQERTASSIDETTTTEKVELTVKDQTGRVEVTKKAPLQHSTIILERAGVF